MKRALVVGINYTGTGNDLKGCINDAMHMRALLSSRGFDQLELLLEKDATTAGIKAALARLVAGAVPGDVLVFHYSGHGSQLPSKLEADGFEEIICPIDLNWTTKVITDADLKRVFNAVPKGANTTLILDCCHSGDALNQDVGDSAGTAPKALEQPALPADGRYLAPPASIEAKLEERTLVDWQASRDVNDSALLIAGSHANQTSADAYIDGVHQGAATYALLQAVKVNPNITYKELMDEMTGFMITGGYTQRPELDGYPGLYTEIFCQPFGWADASKPAEVVTAAATAPVLTIDPVPPATKLVGGMDKTTLLVLAITAIAVFLFLVF